ncbi:hypothetical protein [Escherichia coli]|uniref:hypothetical protein n=1 Tax=Escherichia coli TaxID=562 RepID=UPI000C9FBD24|nr:hypothetical protein [Escherichia coli]EFA5294746.1 DUF1269 domain-containing protein [Escherichia coli]EFB6349627.1 DUF1269 domain-containing protein [Escherichia coli]EFB6607527.1 DUF1269 domain-containing protein [Escherichia coli]EFO3034321.1 DUF1269 domain-containing protein [Escherichia coli]EGJ2082124.1 DUF1269 domain-containing protein [Escherichia coli]
MSNIPCSADNNPEKYPETVCQEYNCTGGADDIRFFFKKSLERTVSSVIRTETLRNTAKRVDGLIIGTGEADFTKDNTHYNLRIDDKDFQLIDVPGIEGNETCYTHLVKKAIAQAHLVVYVNGTNKKPETSTAKKIKSYLEYGTQVYPLINVRGYSDDYEFEEDRVALEQQGRGGEALCQTVGVLASVLGADVLLNGNCVQGLLAFSALAYDDNTHRTTIHPLRDRNLAVYQRGFFNVFPSRQEMLTFSQIDAVAQTIKNKVATFREDIIESNKYKVRETLDQYLQVLEEQLNSHHCFLQKTIPEFEKCRTAFKNATGEFERRIANSRRNRWNSLFNDLGNACDGIVEHNFGDSSAISTLIRNEYEKRRKMMEQMMQEDTEESVKVLQEQTLQAVNRLLEDIHNVELQHPLSFANSRSIEFSGEMVPGYELGMADFSSMVLKIGSYAMSGSAIGSIFPVIGTLVGSAVGALLGIIMTIAGIFTSKASKIRKAQGKIRNKLEEVRDKSLCSIPDETRLLVAAIEKELECGLLQKLNDMQVDLQQPVAIFETQISRITTLKKQLEKMPYGTIQTVQY